MTTEIQTKPHIVDSTGDHAIKNRPPVANPILKDEWCYHFMDVDSKNLKPRADKKDAFSTQVSRTDVVETTNEKENANQIQNQNQNQNSAIENATSPPLLPEPSTSKISLNSTWGDNRREIYTFKTVKELFELFAFMLLPSKGRVKNDYMFFKKGIKPEWEDPNNQNGGKWQLTLPNRYRPEHLDRMVIETLFAMVTIDKFGENYHQICGLYVQRRQKEDRICLWTNDRSDSNKAAILEIGRIWKGILRLDEKSVLTYLKHEDGDDERRRASNGNSNKKDWRNQQNSKLYSV